MPRELRRDTLKIPPRARALAVFEPAPATLFISRAATHPLHYPTPDPLAFVCMIGQEEEVFITSGNWRGKDNSLSRYGGADQPQTLGETSGRGGGVGGVAGPLQEQ